MIEPCRMQFGPIKTLFPIYTFLVICVLSWITVLSPILTPSVPIMVAPYQIEDFYPALTFPMTVAFGATKSVLYNSGLNP